MSRVKNTFSVLERVEKSVAPGFMFINWRSSEEYLSQARTISDKLFTIISRLS